MNFLKNEDLNKGWEFKPIIDSKISIVELMKKYGVKLEEKNTGTFSHRAYCPFHSGKNGGQERTPSFFVSEKTNSFCCYGCNSTGSLIDFVSIMEGCPPIVALHQLAKSIGLIKDGKWDDLQLDTEFIVPFDPTKISEPYIIEMSDIIRRYIKKFIKSDNFEKELRWVEKICKKLDNYLDNITNEDWEDAIKLRDNLSKIIKSRVNK